MKPWRQVLHVTAADVRRLKWLMLAWAGVSGATAAILLARPGAADPGAVSFLLMVAGMFVAALLVQSDSPVRPDAFWVTRPLHPLAVFGAKALGLAGLVAGIPLLGQLAGLLAHQVPATDLLPLLVGSLGVALAWFAAAGVLAALLRDIRSFVVALMATAIGLAALLSWLASQGALHRYGAGLPQPYVVPGIVLTMLLAMAWQYRTRAVRHGVAAALVALLVSAVLLFWTPRAVRVIPAGAPAELTGELTMAVTPARGSWWVRLALRGGSGDHRYVLMRPVVHLVAADGSRERLRSEGGAVLVGGTGELGPGPGAPPLGTTLHVRFEPAQERRLRQGATLELTGLLEVRASQELMRLPVHPRAATARAGHRIRLTQVDERGVNLLQSSVTRPSVAVTWLGDAGLSFQLATGREEPPLELHQRASSRQTGGLILPTAAASRTLVRLEPLDGAARRRDDAELLVTRWVPLGSFRVTARAAVPPLASQSLEQTARRNGR